MISNIKALISPKLKKKIRLFIDQEFRKSEAENERIRNLQRFTEAEIDFLDKRIRIVDIASFQFMKRELFEQQIYKFCCDTDNPYIIDCGANIGLSIIYFKQLFPNAEIVAFEPDDKVFKVLNYNIETFNLPNVKLIKKACWNEETTLQFHSEGADGGRAAAFGLDTENITEVQTTRLAKFLRKKVDFLKIDIEGAEMKVLEDCADLLCNVDKLFVEFHSFIDQKQTLGNLLQILSIAGFRYQIQHIGVFSPNPFIKVEQYIKMDLQLNIFAYR